jgi:ubiquinone/menaquinone biosynthesis C-methylase UbiE
VARSKDEVEEMARNLRVMYNAHPFPARYGIPPSKSDERYQTIYQNFLHLPVGEWRDMTFLDAGCGTGDVTWVWRRLLHPSNRVLAVDLSFNSINIARAACPGAEPSPIFSVGSLLNIGLPDNSVDVVHCSGVLVAVPDPDRAFRELMRILKPGGYVLLALYHKYGRALHGLRRAIVDLLEPDDIDRRAALGGKLFGRSMQQFVDDEHSPLENILYDQFGLPCESRYSVGDALHWFEQAGIDYLGTWPPVEWSQLGKGLRFSKQFNTRRNSWWFRTLLYAFREPEEPPQGSPGRLTRITMESMWMINQQQLFSISGRKKG